MPLAERADGTRATALRVMLALLALLGAAFALSQYSAPWEAKPEWRRTFESIAFLPLQVGSTVALLIASRREALSAAVRRALRAFAAGFAFVALGSAIWFVLATIGRPPAYISWVDLVYFQFYPGIIAGLITLPSVQSPRDRTRDLLGWVVVLLAFGGLAAFALTVDTELREMTPGLRLVVIATSAAQLVSLMFVNLAIERAHRVPSPFAMVLLVGALGLAVMGDLVFQILFSTGYTGPNLNVLIAIVVNLAVVRAAIAFVETPLPGPEVDTAPRIPFSPLPIIAVSAVALMLVWMSSTGYATGTGSLLAALVGLNALLVLRDVLTSRAAAEAMQLGAKREAERRIEALVRHASDAILLLDESGRIMFASTPADRLFGRVVSGAEGRALDSLLPDESADALRTFLAALRAAPGRPETLLWQLPRSDGSTRLIEAIGLDLRNEPGVLGTVLNLRDVTERVSLEERLRQAQKLEVAGRLAGGVAHDFNNVLTTVIASTELAQLSLDPSHPAYADLEGIANAAQRGAALTRRLLAFVRQEPVPAQSVDVSEMLRDIEPLLVRLAGEATPVVVRAPQQLGEVRVDRTELEHIVFNLVANARDAMPQGGEIAVTAEVLVLGTPPTGDAFVILPPAGRHVALSVTDGGTGMSAEVQRRMFDPFFTQKSGGRGTGLGLIGVRPLIEGAKGGLRVESVPGNGTRVTLILPLTGGEAGGLQRVTGEYRAVLPVATGGPGHRVLLVEDELVVREQLTRLLEALGHSVVAAASAQEARILLAQGVAVDVLVSDVMMPGETGIEFASWFRAARPGTPVLLISGHTGTALDREARSVGDLPLLRKPFGGAELADRLATLLRDR